MAGLMGESLEDEKLVEEIVSSIASLPGLAVMPLTLEDLTHASELMKEYRLDYEDAIHLSVALRGKAKRIISNDRDFDKTPIERAFI